MASMFLQVKGCQRGITRLNSLLLRSYPEITLCPCCYQFVYFLCLQ
jgi:hypothetical protein